MDAREAIEVIMDMYGDEIKRFIFTYMKNAADTDDISQEVFITVYQKLHTFKGKSSLKSWIYAIAINRCKDYLKSWHRRNQKLQDKIRRAPDQTVIFHETPEDHVMQADRQNEMLQHVLQLPIKYREVIILFYFHDFSVRETSQALNTRETTVRTRLFRAREQLKQQLIERGDFHG